MRSKINTKIRTKLKNNLKKPEISNCFYYIKDLFK